MKKIMITGGAGFIGTHLAERLLDKCDIILFDSFRRDSLSKTPVLKARNVPVINGDILDAGAVRKAMEGADTVVHLAAIAGVSSYYKESLKTLQTNILGTVNVLEAAVNAKVARFVYFSTSEVFGSNALWVKESDAHGIGPVSDRRWVYATSKLAGENFSMRYAEQYGFACTAVRPFNIYGPRQVGEGAISNFCRAVAKDEPLNVYGDGSALRAWCYISDLIDAVMAILDKPETAGEVFNIGNPSEVENTIGLARRVARLAGGKKIQYQEGESGEVRARVPNIDKARKMLNFEPKVDLDQGLISTINWFKSEC